MDGGVRKEQENDDSNDDSQSSQEQVEDTVCGEWAVNERYAVCDEACG